MKVVMDADCLIKLTKASLKECVCNTFDVTIPHTVKEEVVDRGMIRGLPDAELIDKNIKAGRLRVGVKRNRDFTVGEKEAVALFENGGFDAIGSDDKRFIKQLRLYNIPYITPAVFIAIMLDRGAMVRKEAMQRLSDLSEYISENEYYSVKLFIERWREKQ